MKSFLYILFSLNFLINISGQKQVRLLMRADDMGIAHDVNHAIIKAHKEGIITSVSLMPTSTFFEEAVELCKANPSLVVGVHVTLVASKLPSVLSPHEVRNLLTEAGFFYETAEELIKASPSEAELEKEIRAQVDKVKATGLKITYIDYHRNVPDVVKRIILKVCEEQKLIYGQESSGELYGYKRVELMPETWPFQMMPDGQRIYIAGPAFGDPEQKIFFDKLSGLAPGNYISAVHPGTMNPQRRSVTELACSPKTSGIIKERKIKLISYKDIWDEKYGARK